MTQVVFCSWRPVLLTFCLQACGGTVGSEGGPGGGGSSTGGGGGGVVALECPAKGPITPGAAPLRRLTRAEYNATVLELLGDSTNPADAFPPEEPVRGFKNNVVTQGVTYDLANDGFRSAEKLATDALARLNTIAPCDSVARGEEPCAREFIDTFGKRAFRRPLTDTEKASYLVTFQKGRMTGDFKNGIRLTTARFLGSPYFLYRPEWGDDSQSPQKGVIGLTPWETATRLSYLLWGSMPDAELFAAAESNELSTDEQIDAQVQRMLANDRAKPAVRQFYSGWLLLDKLATAAKDDKHFPGFGKVVPAMQEEIKFFMDDVLWNGSIRDLFSADHTYVNKDLAAFLSLPASAATGAGFERVTLDPMGADGPGKRAGVLSMPGLLAAFSKPDETSPILRGKFVTEQILCAEVPLPPGNVPPLPAVDTSQLTTRQRFEQHAEAACASCHRMMDPLGFAFEHFDAAGRFRDNDKGQPIDASGSLQETDVDGDFKNGVELSMRLAGSKTVEACVATQWLRHAIGRSETSDDEHSLAQLRCGMGENEPRFVDMLAAFTHTDSFRYFSATQGGQQ
jgi:Protein of unknown function (DUF1592)/Protein of unknown function (DUF1588)/Protein of unknown function (DUF1595)/Protein of unknown function (DUF1587)/Protein of unknown function (DUF1585)